MKTTNKLNLPEPFVNFYNSDKHELIENRYSVTELLKPVQEIILFRKHYNEISEDIADSVPAIFGSAVHYVFEKNTPEKEGLLSEYKFEQEMFGKILAGKSDLVDLNNQEIIDYKTSSVSKILKQDFNDYYLQDMMYAYMTLLKFDVKIKKLKNYILMKDWSKLKSQAIANYPKSPIYVWEYTVKDSDYDNIYSFIKNKFKEIDNGITCCLDEEKWYSGNKYAVYRNKTDIKAKKVFDSLTEAELYKTENKFEYIEKRLGENIKCNYYCTVKDFCEQYRKEKMNGEKSI